MKYCSFSKQHQMILTLDLHSEDIQTPRYIFFSDYMSNILFSKELISVIQFFFKLKTFLSLIDPLAKEAKIK